MAAIIGPVAFFIGIILAFNRLNSDSELAVLSATGMSPLRLLRPMMIAAFLGMILCGLLTTWIVPSSIQTWRTMITQIRSDFLTKIVKPGRFNELEKDVIFHYRERSGDALLGIFIQDSRDPDLVLVYVAEHGRIVAGKEGNYLVLENGSVQRETRRDQDASIVAFQRYALDLTQLAPGNEDLVFQPHERLTIDLLTTYLENKETSANEIRIGAELADRLSTPLFTFTFAAIAFAFLGRPRTTRSITMTGIMASIASGAVIRIIGFALIVAAKTSPYIIVMSVLFPALSALFIVLTNLAFTGKINFNPLYGLANLTSALRMKGRGQ
jgi:lipopolysaccharide export system permease protein